jgi:cysteinyl-tRNA synthetase
MFPTLFKSTRICIFFTAAATLLAAGPAAADRTSVRNAKSWSIQLQGDQRSIAKRDSDVAVVDPDEVPNPKSLKNKASGGKRAVLAYISIGEAEEGRGYMKKKGKRWLTNEIQGWAGNYKVRFWDDEWKSIVKSRVKAAIRAGYDGVYLDRVDTYENIKAPGGSRKEMIKFVKEISEEARGENANAAIAVQNAEELLTDNGYVDTIDAIGKEDLYHGIRHDGQRNNAGAIKASVANLKKAKSKGKGVYVVEYLGGELARKVKDEARRDGFVASTGHRKLSQATD